MKGNLMDNTQLTSIESNYILWELDQKEEGVKPEEVVQLVITRLQQLQQIECVWYRENAITHLEAVVELLENKFKSPNEFMIASCTQ